MLYLLLSIDTWWIFKGQNIGWFIYRQDVLESCLEETVAHFVSISVIARQILQLDLSLAVAVPLLRRKTVHRRLLDVEQSRKASKRSKSVEGCGKTSKNVEERWKTSKNVEKRRKRQRMSKKIEENRRTSKNVEERRKNVEEGPQNIGKLPELKFNQLYLLLLTFEHEGSNKVETELK